jgi:UDP-N-acetylmuramate--alanine ligase
VSTPSTRFDFSADVPEATTLGRVHFIAIGGAGMSGVARVMLARGIPVTGSDAKDSLVLRALAVEGADVHVGHDAALVDDVDTVVISSAIRESNVELAAARARGLRVLHRSQALASLMQDRRRVAVAGANGKTTTTSMLTVALQACGADPSFAVGGELAKHGTNAHHGTGEVFVAEADESDGSFLVYRPEVAIVTNVQPDHLDFYGSFEAVQDAYVRFARTVAAGGLLVTCADDEGSRALAEVARAEGVRVLSYGFHADSDVRLAEPAGSGLTSSAELHQAGAPVRRLQIGIPGRHNLLNATAAFLAGTAGLGHDPAQLLAGLAGFTGTRRRFEPKGEADGVRVVDDYAHNPGKVAAVVETGVEQASPGRLVVVFQPHLYSRTRDFAGDLAAALSPADVVVVMDVYAAREDPVPGVSGALVADRVGGRAETHYVPSWSQAAPTVAGLVRPGDLVLTVGAGDVTLVGPELLRLLAERHSPAQGGRAGGPAKSGGPAGPAGPAGPDESGDAAGPAGPAGAAGPGGLGG